MWCVIFSGFLTRRGGEVADEVFVDETKNVITLLSVGGYVVYDTEQVTYGFSHASCRLTETGEATFQRTKNVFEHMAIGMTDMAGE